MSSSLSRIITLTKRNIQEIVRDPLSLIFIIGLPLVMEVMFYLLFHTQTSQFEMKYLAPGIVVFSQTFLSLFIATLISLDKSTSFLTRLFVSKTKPHEFIISYLFSLIPLVLIQSILFFLIGIAFDTSLFRIEIIFSILLSLFTSLLFLGLGILFGSLCNERSVGGISSIVISLHSLLSGMWFPAEGLDDKMINFLDILPFKNATILIQNSLNGFNDLYKDFFKPFIIVLLYTVVILILAVAVYKKKMKDN